MSLLLELRDIHVSYDETEIVHGVDLQLHEGQLCALLGLNGSGKTTLLRGLCGLIPATGEALVTGQNLRVLNERERAKLVSFIPQTASAIFGKTVMEVMLMGFNPHLRLLESPGPKHRELAMQALEKLHMAHNANRQFMHLSQGQRQLIILARTLVQDTPVMLMDEPDSALDFLNRHMVLENISGLIHAEQRAGIITLHDPNFAMRYCDRLLLLKEGRVVGQADMRQDDQPTLKEKLSLVYGKIDLLRHHGNWLLVKED